MANNEIWTIGRILKWTEQYFEQKGVESPRLDAEVLLSHLLKKQRIYLYVHFDEPLQAEELAAYREMIKKRVAHVPVAYILGEKEFMGLTFRVTSDTLVPRPDTEILVQTAVDALKGLPGGNHRFADIGTGSGAICLSVLHFTEGTEADTVDISPAARAVAEQNAESLGLVERITFHTGDLLEPIKGNTYTAILSNPPYIPQADIETLAPEVRCKEPMTALCGGADGLDFYRRLCAEAPAMLEAGGFMAFEVGIHQAEAVANLAKEHPLIERTEIIKDYAGIDRVVVAWRKK
ncbi:MAG: peptide chain release factor N(5)-glutamine methyltransferase [Selenomonas sp.]|uniref:peptide chain release factor N(5)-glutamine methyltransferase n=1 Tax=Selenomonas sp. TaxID=2053611 RepID=UPI0025E40426|nr:peptide chain release factor N(5)-glutamine methyltransferase [Selenomonas sp.]MCR5438935.1 peptide chain release factor N(5)-glutamine methyltransferase [Selenomonas sp.]